MVPSGLKSRHFKLLPYLVAGLLVALIVSCSSEATNGNGPPPTVPLQKVVAASGFDQPLFVTFAPGDSTRLFVVEKGGVIKVVKNGTVLSIPFLDISDSAINNSSERGLLGMAFHPDFQSNGYFYVDYTGVTGATHISRFSVNSNPDVADRSSELVILKVEQPYANHNAGMLAFSPIDGYLYVGFGDGGSGGDPQNRAQNPDSLLGKVLRIDVNGGPPYSVPFDNPFVDSSNYRHEIWALGLRNPWRYTFDRQTGDLYIADVGQDEVEEVDFQPSTSKGGQNYGWRLKEGNDCYDPPTGCETRTDLVNPIWTYRHDEATNPCSITGGYVYRGQAIKGIQGMYFCGDYCSGEVWAFRFTPQGGLTDFTDYTATLSPGHLDLVSFGEDYFGELYIVSMLDGTVYRIVADTSGR